MNYCMDWSPWNPQRKKPPDWLVTETKLLTPQGRICQCVSRWTRGRGRGSKFHGNGSERCGYELNTLWTWENNWINHDIFKYSIFDVAAKTGWDLGKCMSKARRSSKKFSGFRNWTLRSPDCLTIDIQLEITQDVVQNLVTGTLFLWLESPF